MKLPTPRAYKYFKKQSNKTYRELVDEMFSPKTGKQLVGTKELIETGAGFKPDKATIEDDDLFLAFKFLKREAKNLKTGQSTTQGLVVGDKWVITMHLERTK